MEANTSRRATGLKDKIPDISKTLDTVRFLQTRKADAEDLETTFELNDTLFAKALVPPTEEVYLWLGANVMLSYPIPEAIGLLEEKLRAAKTSLGNCEEDMDFLREQITVSFYLQLFRVGELEADGSMLRRHWRLRPHGYIIGTLRRGERRGRKVGRKARRMLDRTVDVHNWHGFTIKSMFKECRARCIRSIERMAKKFRNGRCKTTHEQRAIRQTLQHYLQ